MFYNLVDIAAGLYLHRSQPANVVVTAAPELSVQSRAMPHSGASTQWCYPPTYISCSGKRTDPTLSLLYAALERMLVWLQHSRAACAAGEQTGLTCSVHHAAWSFCACTDQLIAVRVEQAGERTCSSACTTLRPRCLRLSRRVRGPSSRRRPPTSGRSASSLSSSSRATASFAPGPPRRRCASGSPRVLFF
jgi:hypothetical protein